MTTVFLFLSVFFPLNTLTFYPEIQTASCLWFLDLRVIVCFTPTLAFDRGVFQQNHAIADRFRETQKRRLQKFHRIGTQPVALTPTDAENSYRLGIFQN